MRDDDRPRQLPLDLGHRTAQSRDDLIVSPANRDAVALIERWPDWPSTVVILAGPPGSGKSHLAAIWRDAAQAAETVGSEALDQGLVRPVMVDNADTPGLDERGLFHLINAAREAGTHVLLTARRFPAAWGVQLADLASRLQAATVVEIHEPDDLLLAGVITKLFADRQVEVEPNVVQFLVRRIERSLSTAIGVVERLDRAALEQKTRITRVLAADVLSAMDQGQAELDL